MKRIIKFMIFAAFVLPAWLSTAAQNNAAPAKLPDRVKLESESRHKDRPQLTIKDAAKAPQNEMVNNEPQVAPEPQPTTGIRKHSDRSGDAPVLKAPMRAGTVVTPPTDATIETWDLSTTWTQYTSSGSWSQANYGLSSVQVAFDGDDVYINGLCYWLPSAWVKGTFNSAKTQVTFTTGQYYGIDSYDEEDWFVGRNGTSSSSSTIDVVFAYNSATGTLTLASGTYIYCCSDASASSSSDYHTNTVISKPAETVTVANGTVTGQVPIFANYLDWYYHGQVIYPADSLQLTLGTKIMSITFYANNTLDIYSGSKDNTITVKIGETSSSSYGSTTFLTQGLETYATLTSSQILNGTTSLTITFNEPYEYHGGNLVIDASCSYLSSGRYAASSRLWYGQTLNGSSLQQYSSSSSSTTGTQQNFLPKMTMKVQMAAAGSTTELDFGAVLVNTSKTMNAYVANESDSPVTATVTVSPNPPFTVASSTVTLAAATTTPIAVTFSPTNAVSYSGTLSLTMGDVVKNIPLKGVGNISGAPEAIRDSTFYAGITYNWTDSNGGTHTSSLDEIATDPNQIIAMMKEVYTNKEIPGNLKRGFSSTGTDEIGNLVNYPGVGTISHTGSSYTTGYSYEDDYGWNIPGKLETPVTNVQCVYSGYYRYADYCYMDSLQYQPHYDGVTLLLVEMVDTFSYANVTAKVAALPSTATDYQKLLTQMKYTVKSARIVTQAKRTGTDLDKGTLFKIDCDKMNKFFLLAKGQVRRIMNSMGITNSSYTYNTYRANPSFFRIKSSTSSNATTYYQGFVDLDTGDPFYHMFEQFSPVTVTSEAGQNDVYQSLVNMQSFGVQHDCMGISHMNHQFMMYGEDSEADDCQDVRDMMFFVPDYRMMNFGDINNYVDDETNRDRGYILRYLNYHKEHKPTLGLYVIRQNDITRTDSTLTHYMLQLNWETNLDDFLPSDEQEFELLQLVYDEETGQTKYIPVYYMNAQGQYTDSLGNVVTTPVPIMLQMEAGRVKNYPSVYVERLSHSQEVTYAIRGRDVGHFLSLQISNQKSYIIPGTDPAEKVMLKDATHYSRFNPQTVKNCYSNKIQISNHAGGMLNSYVNNGTKVEIWRTSQKDTEGKRVATITFQNINSSNRSFTVTMENQDAKTEYPLGQTDVENDSTLYYAGYHANNRGAVEGNGSWTLSYSLHNGYVDFGNNFNIWDNFVVDVSENAHPAYYTYKVVTNYTDYTITNGGTAYGNTFRVPVYKTGSQINGSFTKAEVDEDDDIQLGIETDVKFDVDVQLSSKTEILRYDAYRWTATEDRYIVDNVEANGNEDDIAPTGLAMNQGEYYTISMNPETANETNGQVSVSSGSGKAQFVDVIPCEKDSAAAYIYAPVVELFTTGKDENNKTRIDYNTYGGPLQSTAVGKLDVEVVQPSAQVPLMSNFNWTANNKKYAYYQIFLDVKAAEAPEGYSLYGIRAWRFVEPALLGEHPRYPRTDRVPVGDEDIMFEKILGGNGYDPAYNFLGSADATYSDAQEGEVRATFGAQKLRTTEAADDKSVIDELETDFTVRLYFTPAPIHVVGDAGNGNGWDYSTPLASLYSDDGKTYSGTVTIPDAGNGNGYFFFTKKLGNSKNDILSYIFGAQWNDNVDVPVGNNDIWDFNLKYWSNGTRIFKIPAGTYQMTIDNHVQKLAGPDYDAGALHIRQSRDGSSDATGKFYVVEQTMTFHADKDNVVTGIFDIDGVKQVVGVKYYNVAGIESNKPFDGVNIVVTRYSDGSVVTSKMMK